MMETTPRKDDSEWGVAGLQREIHVNPTLAAEAELWLAERAKHKTQELQPPWHFIC